MLHALHRIVSLIEGSGACLGADLRTLSNCGERGMKELKSMYDSVIEFRVDTHVTLETVGEIDVDFLDGFGNKRRMNIGDIHESKVNLLINTANGSVAVLFFVSSWVYSLYTSLDSIESGFVDSRGTPTLKSSNWTEFFSDFDKPTFVFPMQERLAALHSKEHITLSSLNLDADSCVLEFTYYDKHGQYKKSNLSFSA